MNRAVLEVKAVSKKSIDEDRIIAIPRTHRERRS
jgi:hypothetical protein